MIWPRQETEAVTEKDKGRLVTATGLSERVIAEFVEHTTVARCRSIRFFSRRTTVNARCPDKHAPDGAVPKGFVLIWSLAFLGS